jgi:coenzyme F420-reducing hydrogenase delta subunit
MPSRKCPACGHDEFDYARCDGCKLDDLEYARAHSRAGQAMNRLIDLDFMVERFRIGWDEISAEEVRGLQILTEERERQKSEPHEDPQRGKSR